MCARVFFTQKLHSPSFCVYACVYVCFCTCVEKFRNLFYLKSTLVTYTKFYEILHSLKTRLLQGGVCERVCIEGLIRSCGRWECAGHVFKSFLFSGLTPLNRTYPGVGEKPHCFSKTLIIFSTCKKSRVRGANVTLKIWCTVHKKLTKGSVNWTQTMWDKTEEECGTLGKLTTMSRHNRRDTTRWRDNICHTRILLWCVKRWWSCEKWQDTTSIDWQWK